MPSNQDESAEIVVAGHICLDIIPTLREDQSRAEDLFSPGKLVRVGPATLALGGCVANTGLALHRLGAAVRLAGRLGDDLMGRMLLESLRPCGEQLCEDMIVVPGETTSYTVVLDPPGLDRSFLHCAGANDTFSVAELDLASFPGMRLLHFGYPPLMRSVVADGGAALANMFHQVQQRGALVSLDMAMPDSSATEDDIDWKTWLGCVLPHVDLFLPSLDEISMMLDPARYTRLVESSPNGNLSELVDLPLLLESIADELIELGAPIVSIKLGDQGLYLQSSKRAEQLLGSRSAWQQLDWQAWQERQLLVPCFEVDVVGTTGAGDCTIAGFLMALLQGLNPEEALHAATAVGARCVQSLDATSNIPPWSEIHAALENQLDYTRSLSIVRPL